MNIIYRVVLRVGYCYATFEFNTLEKAGDFAKTLLTNLVSTDDTDKKSSVSLEIVNADAESEED
jgi:hypothetical protein